MKDITNTQFFQVETGPQIQAKDIWKLYIMLWWKKDIIR